MNRTVITEDDLSPGGPAAGPSPQAATAASPPSAEATTSGRRISPFAAAALAVAAVVLAGGGFLAGTARRADAAQVDRQIRDAVREVRQGMRADGAQVTERAVERERVRLVVRHRKEMRSLRKRLTTAQATSRAATRVRRAPVAVAPRTAAPAPVQRSVPTYRAPQPAPVQRRASPRRPSSSGGGMPEPVPSKPSAQPDFPGLTSDGGLGRVDPVADDHERGFGADVPIGGH